MCIYIYIYIYMYTSPEARVALHAAAVDPGEGQQDAAEEQLGPV